MGSGERAGRLEALVDRQAQTIERQEEIIQALRETVDDQQETITEQRETIDALAGQLAADDGEPAVSRRGALKAGGLLATLGLGAGTASADAQGQVGTDDRPLETLHTAALAGPLTGGEELTSLAGDLLTVDGGALTADLSSVSYYFEPPDDLSAVQNGMETDDDGFLLITNDQELQAMEADLGADYRLANDIDARFTSFWNGGNGFSPIGNPSAGFTGAFDGDGHVIERLTVGRSILDAVGLFSSVGSAGSVENVGLEDTAIAGSQRVGCLVGENAGTISESYATGRIGGDSEVGGLVGDNSGTISESYATSSVSGLDTVGGLVGTNPGTISGSYATGSVSGSEPVGGLVGNNSSGSDVSSSYWDEDTTNQSAGIGSNGGTASITGLSTSEMQGTAAETNMSALDFTGTWATASGAYPVLQVLDR